MKTDRLILIDSNIWVYGVKEDSPFYKQARSIIDRANKGEIRTCISPQILGEFYTVVTNPQKTSPPLTPDEAVEIIKSLLSTEAVLTIYPSKNTLEITLELVRRYQIKALDFFDAYIVATMLDNRVEKIYTVNDKDFKPFKEIEVINPFINDTLQYKS